MDPLLARKTWRTAEPLHAFIYFVPEADEQYEAAGLDPDNLTGHGKLDLGNEAKVWKTIWSAGQGVGAIEDVPTTAELGARLLAEYRQARASLAG